MKVKYSKWNKSEPVEKSDRVFIPPTPRKKTIIETILSPWKPISSLESGSASISLPAVPTPSKTNSKHIAKPLCSLEPDFAGVSLVPAPGPPEYKPTSMTRPIPILKQSKNPVEITIPDEIIPGPEPGSREWKKQQFKLTNFI